MSALVVETGTDRLGRSVPVRFGQPGGRCEEIESVLDRWVGEDHRYFRVRVRGGSEFILRHDLAAGAWRVHFFRGGEAEG